MSDEIDLTSPEVKAAIDAAVKERLGEETAGLIAKRDELLGKIKKLQQGQQIDPADLEAVERERDEWKGKAQAAEKAAKKAASELEAANKARDEIDANFNRSLSDAALTEALTKAGVTNPVHLKAAKALLSGSVEVVNENGARVVKAGDKALADHITEWAGGDEGKHFVAAPDTTGGGAQGGHRTNPQTGALPDVTDKAGRAAAFAKRLATAQQE